MVSIRVVSSPLTKILATSLCRVVSHPGGDDIVLGYVWGESVRGMSHARVHLSCGGPRWLALEHVVVVSIWWWKIWGTSMGMMR